MTNELPKHNDSEQQTIRPLTNAEMDTVSGGFLQVPPFHGAPVPRPTLPVIPVPTV